MLGNIYLRHYNNGAHVGNDKKKRRGRIKFVLTKLRVPGTKKRGQMSYIWVGPLWTFEEKKGRKAKKE